MALTKTPTTTIYGESEGQDRGIIDQKDLPFIKDDETYLVETLSFDNDLHIEIKEESSQGLDHLEFIKFCSSCMGGVIKIGRRVVYVDKRLELSEETPCKLCKSIKLI